MKITKTWFKKEVEFEVKELVELNDLFVRYNSGIYADAAFAILHFVKNLRK